MKKAIVIGLDGLDSEIVESMLQAGELPHLAQIRASGGYSRMHTTCPAMTPVAWATFATGTNPGGHGIFDFIRRDPNTYLPDFSLNRYEQKTAYLPPRVLNLRRGTAVWELLSANGIPSTIVRCPCTYPPDAIRGRILAGMGVPDVRGSLGTSTFYTSEAGLKVQESENVVHVRLDGNATISTHLIGPRDLRTRSDFRCGIVLHLWPSAKKVVLRSDGQPPQLEIREGQWSDWLKVKFKTGLLQSIRGMVRFYLVRTEPVFELYASPINFDPEAPVFPISAPPGYAGELEANIGTFYTTGMVEDHNGLNNGHFGEAAFLEQCAGVLRERERMMTYELERFDQGLFFCLFDTPDRIQHMFWRFREAGHPANRHHATLDQGPESVKGFARVIEEHYRACDVIVGKALKHADKQTLLMVLSDHGMGSFQRGVELNTWLHDHGLMVLQNGVMPGMDTGDFFRNVDWSRTKAYALGMGGIYLNLRGREGCGIVDRGEVEGIRTQIANGLSGLRDPDRGTVAIRSVQTREKLYAGPYAGESPDLVVNFARGYRVAWKTALGGLAKGQFEDNVKRWSGDHTIDPLLVPGVLFMNRAFRGNNPHLVDLAPTILSALGISKGPAMEGQSLI